MARKKLQRFAELARFPNTFEQPGEMKGNWHASYFKNDNPITLELACGKGEYTIGLAQRFPNRNFIGVDVKGARVWRGALTALEQNLENVAFVRDLIERLTSYFEKDEISEIWMTFPDPFPKRDKAKRRLTSPRFLCLYRQVLQEGGQVHLKTDDRGLFDFTIETLRSERGTVHGIIEDLYSSPIEDERLTIQTTYELKHLAMGKRIRYVCFSL